MSPRTTFALTLLGLFAPAAFAGEAPALPTPLVEGYRGIWFTLGKKYSGGLGTYTANHNPLAVYAAEVNKTFFVYGGSPTGKLELVCMIGSYDHRTGRVARPVMVHDKRPVKDPHDNPSLNVDANGYIWVFVSGRAQARPGFVYRSRAPYDITQFDRFSEKVFTYPQPWYVTGRGFLFMFTRYTNGRELYWETSPDGRVWSEAHKLAGIEGHYQTSGAREGKIATFFNRHPEHMVDKRTDLYYAQTTDFGKTWTTIEGVPLTLPLATPDNPARVVNYSAQGRLVYTCDLNFDAKGEPILLYVVSQEANPGPNTPKREWTVAHRKDGRWLFSTITTSDHNYDMGSLYVLPNEWLVIAPTDPGPQPWGTGGEMVLWSSRDEGATWTRRRNVTQGSELNHSYARRPRNAHDPFFAFWADGNPNQPSVSRLYFCDSSGQNVWRLPYDFPAGAETAPPEKLK